MFRKLLVFVLALPILAKPAPEATATGASSALQTCLQEINSKVCDPNGALNQEQMQKLNDALEQMEKQTIQEGYAFDKNQRQKCGQKGVVMPLVVLKEDTQDLSATEKMLIDMNRQWTLKHPCDRVAIIMLNTAEKIEQRRFWAGRNWNVNVEPSEMVQLYRKEIPLIQKADYVEALLNMLREFTAMVAKRPGPASDQKINQQQKTTQQQQGQQQQQTPSQQQDQPATAQMVKAEESGTAAAGATNNDATQPREEGTGAGNVAKEAAEGQQQEKEKQDEQKAEQKTQ